MARRRMLRWILAALGVLGAFARPAQVAAQSPAAAFNPLVTVSNTAGQVSDLAAITLDGTAVYVAWREAAPGGQQIRLRRSTNGGVSFIDSAAGRVVAPVDPAETVYTVRVAAAGPLVYVLYTSGVEPRLAKARLARSADGGATFAPPTALAGTLQYGGTSFADLAVDGTGVVHVVIEDRETSDDIHYLLSTDQGITFSAPAALGSSPKPSVRPRIAARGSQLAVVWEELSSDTAGSPAGDIAFVYSIDAGTSFGAVRNLSATTADSNRPAVAIGNAIQVVWTEGNSVALRSSPDGAAFTPSAQIAVAPAGETIAGAAVGSAAETVHVSWTTVNADGVMNGPFYRRSTDGAGTFAATQDLRLGFVGAPYGLPAIANGIAARIVWPHSASGFAVDADVLFAGQPNCGASWAAPVSGNWHDATKWSPAVVPGVGSSACITVEGGPYTVTVAGNQNAGELTIGHATSEVRPIVRITGGLTIGSSLVNSGELTFGGGGRISSTAGIVVNSERGRFNTVAGAPALLGASVTNHGDVVFAANMTTFNFTRVFTNHRSWRIENGATFTIGLGHTFTQAGGVLDVKGVASMISAQFNFLGGDIPGQITLEQLAGLHIGTDAAGPGTFVFRFGNSIPGGTARLSGSARSNHTIKILACCNDGKGGISVTAASGFTNAGTIVLGGEPGNTGQGVALVGTALVNTGTVIVDGVGGGPRRLDMHVENRGTFDVQHSLGLFGTAGRTFTNEGTMSVADGADVTFGASFVFNQNGGVLQNAGRMEMSGEFSTAGDTFNYNGGAVDGVVIIQGHSHLRIGAGSTGPGTFQFERNSANATFAGDIAPAQTLRLITQPGANGASVVAANGFTNAGTIVMDAASLVVTAGMLVNTGTIAVDATSPVTGRAIDANIDNRGTFTVRADLSFRGTNRTFTNTGTVRVFDGATVTVGSAAVFNQQAGVFDLGGALVLNTEFNTGPDTFNFNGGSITGASGVHLMSTSRLNIGAGAANGEGRFVYRVPAGGTISGNLGPRMTLRIQGSSVTAANGLTNAGDIVLAVESSPTQGASLAVTAGTLVNTGTITVEPTATDAPLNAVIENHGRITIKDTINMSRVNANHLNQGVVEIASGNTLTLMGNATLRNLAPGGFGGAGTLSIANGSTFTAAGALAINVTNAGRFRPGASPGIVNITGGYTQTTTGRLEIEIAGGAAGSGFDRVNVGGVATLAGTLDVQVAAGFCIEGSYPFLTYAVVAGDFPTRLGLTASGGRSLVPSRGATAYALNASGPPCNEAPVANPDAYSTNEGTALSVAAPGAIGNDTDAQGDALTAVVAAGPTNGTLTLNPNGSFTYIPNPGFSGTDGFTYRASDGTAQSGIAAVTISVLATAPPVITSLTPDALTVGLVRALQISGAHFSAPTVTLRKGDFAVTGNLLVSTPTTIHAEFDVTSVPFGDWTVTVENQNGRRVDAPIVIKPSVIVVAFAWDGIQGFPLMPAGRVSGRANYLTVINVGLTDGMVPVTLDLPHPAMRLKVGAHTERMHTGGSVTFLVWVPLGVEVRVPLYWGISPEDINMPGMVPIDPDKPTFGQMLSFKVRAPMGLTAGSGQVSELLGRLFADTGLSEDVLERITHEATKEAKFDMGMRPGTVELGEVLLKLREKLEAEPSWQQLDIQQKNLFDIEFEKKHLEAQERDVWQEELRNSDLISSLAREQLAEEVHQYFSERGLPALGKHFQNAAKHDPAYVARFFELFKDLERREYQGRYTPQKAELLKALTVPAEPSSPQAKSEAEFKGPPLRPGRSQDPNDKAANTSLYCQPAMVGGTPQCAPYFVGPEHTTAPIEYVIQFENLAEATAAAETVVITDVLDEDLDPSTLRVVTTSHPGTDTNPDRFSFDVAGNVATFRWTGIDLPPNVESPEGEGYVMFTIQPRPGLASGTEIRNSASIVFDFNPPIVTPEVVHVVDTSPPVTAATPSVAANAHGWNRTDVTVTLRGGDGANGSGIKQIHVRVDGGPEQVVAGAAAVIPLTDEGVHSISYFAVDNVGNTETARVLTVRIDKTPPVVTGARATPPNRHGWNNGPVVVSFTASDTLSGIDGSPTVDVTLRGEGANQSASLGFTDKAGNSASATISGINIDVTAPTVAGAADRAPNAHGWYNANVAVSFTCADALSGVDTCGPTPQVISEAGSNLSRTGVVTDRAGNTAQATVGGINLDKTAPAIACSNSAPVLWPPDHKLVAVQTAVTVTDGLSGPLRFTLLRATSNEPDNGLGDGDTADDIQDFTIGTPDTRGLLRAERSAGGTGRIYSLLYEGVDLAGNSATCTTTVTVPHNQGNGKK